MDFATRQFAGSAGRPTRSQPSTYFGQCDLTHCGIKKFAEIGSQPRAAASVTPFENGATAVTTIGGWGPCNGFGRGPPPRAGINCLSSREVQYLPLRFLGGPLPPTPR